MTVSYAYAVSSVNSSTFLKLFRKWKGSILKAVWKELLIWLILYSFVGFVVNCFLDTVIREHCRAEFEAIDGKLAYFDLKFMLGFFVSAVVDRWKNILQNIAFIETTALSISTLIRGKDDNVRLARRSIIRYIVLSQILVFRDISMRVRRRFPTMQSLIDSGFLFENERKEIDEVDTQYNKYWMPINWANSIVFRMQEQKYIDVPVSTNNVLNNIRDFRNTLDNLCKFDWVPLPIAYPQVVFLAVRVYFLICIFSRQHVIMEQQPYLIHRHFPFMTVLQFVFYVGWMKVAEALLNPLGEDDDDFEGNWVIDKNITTGMQIVDGSHNACPDLHVDKFSEPKFGPMYPLINVSTGQIGFCQGSVADVVICESPTSSKMVTIDSVSMSSKDQKSSSMRRRFSKISQRLSLSRTISGGPKSPEILATPTKNLEQVTEEDNVKIDIEDQVPKNIQK
ncbi:unnamed protein product [Caenorhabditis angaria]|uniref:Bestrophin homolog n=1 Tax=Caenorhabditis angaria TaxID=860376 RepID=A0A9P1N5N9_9PELO|nr:unnamed protein product [Caenorhabditis angaria]